MTLIVAWLMGMTVVAYYVGLYIGRRWPVADKKARVTE
jgi:hypothetical protein